jgi:CheY-like chemotaxis protein
MKFFFMIEGASMRASPEKYFQLVLVDNDDDDVFFIERALRRAGHDFPFTRLHDGREAIEYFERLEEGARPDLVLLDVQMPLRNGFEVLQWLRGQPKYEKLTVMMLTSSDDPSDIRRAQALGATDFLTKSPTCAEIVETLRRLAVPGAGSEAVSLR